MSERKRPNQTWESFADEQIRAAEEAGEFAHLPGLGQPLAGLDEPHDENWWLKEKLKRERLNVLPPALEIARDAAQTLASLDRLLSENSVRRELLDLNDRIRAANLATVWGPPMFTQQVDVEAEVAGWRERKAGQ